eukprot:6422528-Amphidinium_carterae.1
MRQQSWAGNPCAWTARSLPELLSNAHQDSLRRGVSRHSSQSAWIRETIQPGMPDHSSVRHKLTLLHGNSAAYLLGLLAMTKCSICSYQCDN